MSRVALAGAAIFSLLFAADAARASSCSNNLPPSTPTASFQDQSDGTTTDTRTGLTWARCSEGQSWTGVTCAGSATTLSWAAALARAETSTLAGQDDWRVPNIKELQSLVEECRSSPAINTAVFPESPSSGSFWTGTPLVSTGNTESAWTVDAAVGRSGSMSVTAGLHLRLVRGGWRPAEPPPAGGVAVLATEAESGRADRLLADLPQLSDARLAGSPLVAPAITSADRSVDTQADSPYDDLGDGVVWTSFSVPDTFIDGQTEYLLIATAEAASAQELHLYVGRSEYGDQPVRGEQLCMRSQALNRQTCEMRIRPLPYDARFWALAHLVGSGSTGTDRVAVKLAVVPLVAENKALVVTGAGHVDAGTPFRHRASWDDPSWLPGEERVGYVLVYSQPGELVYYEPLWLRREGSASAARLLRPGVEQTLKLGPGEAQERLYVDIPSNATAVSFTTSGSGDLALYAAHAPSPQAPTIEPAPARSAAQHLSAQPGANQTITLSGSQLLPGRWYLTPVNTGTTAAEVIVTASITTRSARPLLRPGHYYNPQRSGQGVFVDFAGDQWVLVWYAYLQDGTPTWYYAQNPAPVGDEAQWSSPLYRVVWNGNATNATVVGHLQLTMLPGDVQASPKLTMSYTLDGEGGWEPLTRLGDDSCPSYSGQRLDATGHWYSPARSGFGYSAQFLPNTEVHAAYVYDGQGYPRWLYGQQDYDAGAVSVQLLQLIGFCPTCPAKPLESKVVGTLTRLLSGSSNNDGKPGLSHMEVNAILAPPLQGTWQQSLPVFMLSERKGCQ